MRGMNIYQQLQFAIITVLFFAWVVAGTISFIVPDPSDFIVNTYGKLEAVFLTLASLKTLETAISAVNGVPKGDKPDEKATDTPPAAS